jgi:hypothetical protein
MHWIDLKLRKPTEADANPKGEVFWINEAGEVNIGFWYYQNRRVAWMPIPEFTPIPDPPEGYQFLADYDATPHPNAMCWDDVKHIWESRVFNGVPYTKKNIIYAVPIQTPEPQYRPFANAAEFRPYRERWWKLKSCETLRLTIHYSDALHHGFAWKDRFQHIEFEDGTPFGMPVGGDE